MSGAPNPPIPTSFFRSVTAERVREEGRVEAHVEIVLRVLDKRHIPVSDEVRERIAGCTDLVVLGTWFDRALDVDRAGEIFAED